MVTTSAMTRTLLAGIAISLFTCSLAVRADDAVKKENDAVERLERPRVLEQVDRQLEAIQPVAATVEVR